MKKNDISISIYEDRQSVWKCELSSSLIQALINWTVGVARGWRGGGTGVVRGWREWGWDGVNSRVVFRCNISEKPSIEKLSGAERGWRVSWGVFVGAKRKWIAHVETMDGWPEGGSLSLSLSLSFFLSLSVSLWPWPWRWGFLFQRKLTWFRQVLRRVSYFPNPRKHSTYPINSRVHIFHALITLILSVAFHVYWILCVWLFLIVNTADLIGNVDDEGGARRLDSDWKLVPHLIAHYLLVRVK